MAYSRLDGRRAGITVERMHNPVNDGGPALAAVTFDVGGTLLQPEPGVGAVYAEVFARYGVEADPARIDKAFQRAWTTLPAETGGATDEAAEIAKWRRLVAATLDEFGRPREFDRLFRELWDTFAEPRRWRLRDHARDVLSGLRDRGIRLAVLSNWDSRLHPLLEGLGLARYFEAIFISAEIGWEKPDARLFRAVEDRLSLPPPAILHVGDSPVSDARAARAAGWRSLLIRDGDEAVGDEPEIRDLRELLLLLPRGNRRPPPAAR